MQVPVGGADEPWASHIANLDPPTTISILTELLELRGKVGEQRAGVSLDEFGCLPSGTIVHKTWPYQGDNAEPEVWMRLHSGNYWVEISDPSGWEYRNAFDVAYSTGARHVVVYQPTTKPAAMPHDHDHLDAPETTEDKR